MSLSRQTLSLEAKIPDGPDEYQFRTAEGLLSPDAFRDAELSLLETLWDYALEDLLVLQANYGVVGTVLGARATSVTMCETSARAVRLAQENLDRNDVTADVSLVTFPTDLNSSFETVCYAPKPYTPVEVGKQRLVDALSMLRRDGRLYVAGTKSSGITRYERCLANHAQAVERIRSAGPCRVIEATASGEFVPPQYVSCRTITSQVDDVDLTMVSEPGLFSAGALDRGTRLLLETATVEDGEAVLDLACGYGPVGACVGKSADVDVVLTDENARATACAEKTLDANGIAGTVVTADCLRGVDRQIDRVLCNPPTHAGSGVLSELFAGVADVLVPDGELSVVHHRALNLDEYLEHVGRITARETGDEHTVVTVRA